VAPVDSPVRRASRVGVEGRRSATGRVAPRQHGRVSLASASEPTSIVSLRPTGSAGAPETSAVAAPSGHHTHQANLRHPCGSAAIASTAGRRRFRFGRRQAPGFRREPARVGVTWYRATSPVPMVTRSSNWAVIVAVRRLFRDRDGLRPGGRCVISSRPLRPLPWRRRRCRRRAPRPLGSVRVLPDRPGSA